MYRSQNFLTNLKEIIRNRIFANFFRTIIYIETRSFGQRGRLVSPHACSPICCWPNKGSLPYISTVTQWIAYTVTWFQPFCLWLSVSHASVQHLPWVPFKAISGEDLKFDAVKRCTDSVVLCLHLCGSDSSQCMTLRWPTTTVLFPWLPISLYFKEPMASCWQSY